MLNIITQIPRVRNSKKLEKSSEQRALSGQRFIIPSKYSQIKVFNGVSR